MSSNICLYKLVPLDEILHTRQITPIIILGQGSFNLKQKYHKLKLTFGS